MSRATLSRQLRAPHPYFFSPSPPRVSGTHTRPPLQAPLDHLWPMPVATPHQQYENRASHTTDLAMLRPPTSPRRACAHVVRAPEPLLGHTLDHLRMLPELALIVRSRPPPAHACGCAPDRLHTIPRSWLRCSALASHGSRPCLRWPRHLYVRSRTASGQRPQWCPTGNTQVAPVPMSVTPRPHHLHARHAHATPIQGRS